ncbi:MAG: PAS domain S-box protein [Methanoregulaceae archaeon]|nr:PAS domain S-box protein [Methanoregulaceae archaeon]
MITVLLVHDSTELLDAARSYLEKMGEVRVDTVSSTKQAMDILKNRSYDVIVSYYHLPEINGIEFLADLNGIEFLKYLKAQGSTAPFILYTRHRDRLTIEDLNLAIEVPLKGGSGANIQLPELRDVIKQTVMRKKAERDLNARFEIVSSILSATPLAICQLRNRTFEWVNGPMTAILGYGSGDLQGKNAMVIFPDKAEYDRASRELVVRVDDLGFGYTETKLLRKDGGVFLCRLRARLLDPADPSKGEIWLGEDTTQIRQLEESLKEAELRYKELLQSTGALVMKMDTDGVITFFNKAAQAFFGYSGPEIIGKPVLGSLIPKEPGTDRDMITLVNELGLNHEASSIRINQMQVRTGERVWIAWTNKAIRDDSGAVTEILCIGHDITDHESRDRVRISTAMWRERVIAGTDVREDVFESVFHIGWEISREGREGHAVGTAFLIGDSQNVLARSKQLILNPFEGHRNEDRMITNTGIKENIKELAQLDGAFVIRGDGLIEAAARYITIDTSSVGIPKGLGTRHSSIAGMTQATKAIGIVISQSGGKISIFRNGKIVQEIS